MIPNIIDIASLPDDEPLFQPIAQRQEEQVAQSATTQPDTIDIAQLTDDQLRGATAASPDVGLLESFGRGAVEGATFGFDDELGFDKEAREASKRANPWTHFLGEMVGTLGPMAVATPLAAVRGAGLAAKATRAAATPFAVGDATTLGRAALQGTKLGASYGAASGAGHADVQEEDTWGDAAKKRALGAAQGAVPGAVIGAPLGVAGYGASKLIGAGLNRTIPELRDVMAASSAPELQAIRELVRTAGHDKYTLADFAALRDRLRDPAQAHRYADLNLLEALEAKPLQVMPGTGELKPPITVSPNLGDMAQDAANLSGAGRHQAVTAFANRKNEMATKISNDIDEYFGDPVAAGLQRQFGQGANRAIVDAERLPTVIDDVFGSGEGAANEAALAARRESLNARYNRLKSKPLQTTEGLNTNWQRIPEFQKALEYAAKNDMIRLAGRPQAEGTGWAQTWAKGDLDTTIRTMSPQNILDVHHALVMNAKPPITGPTPESVMAGQLKNTFSKWVDSTFSRHAALRNDYSIFKRTMEASEQAAKLGSLTGADDHAAMRFFNRVSAEQAVAARQADRAIAAYDRALARFRAGQRATEPAITDLNKAISNLEGRRGVIEAFRARFGENLKRELATSTNPDAVIKKWLTRAGQQRIMQIAGPERGRRLIDQLMVMEARNQGKALSLKGGGDDAIPVRFYERALAEGNTEAVDAFRQAWGDRIKNELATRNDSTVGQVVNALLTREGKNRILRLLGQEQGQRFIETLYNKQQQLGLSQRLWGGPDTAYKLARQKKLGSVSDLVTELGRGVVMPWTFSPGRAWQSAREIASNAYTQRRADRINELLSRQGIEDVGEVIDAILGRAQLAQTGQPYGIKPALRATPPLAAAAGDVVPAYTDRKKPVPPYRP